MTVARFARHAKGQGEEWGTRIHADGPVDPAREFLPNERPAVWSIIVWGTEVYDPEAVNTMRQKGAYCPVPPTTERIALAETQAVRELKAWELEKTLPTREVRVIDTECDQCGAEVRASSVYVGKWYVCDCGGYHDAPFGRHLGSQPGRGDVDEFTEYGCTGLDGTVPGETVVVVRLIKDPPTPKEFWETVVRIGTVTERPAPLGSYMDHHHDRTPRRVVYREVKVSDRSYRSVHEARLVLARRALPTVTCSR